MEPMEILPGKGVGPLRFGMTPEQVAELLGEPSKLVLDNEGDKTATYIQQGLDLDFRASDGFRLVSISVRAINVTIDGAGMATMSQQQIGEAFMKHGFSFYNPTMAFEGKEEWWTTKEGPGSLIVRFSDKGHLLAVVVMMAWENDEPVWCAE